MQHVGHIGLGSDTGGFDVNNIPPEWKDLLSKANISPEELQNDESRKFIEDFVNAQGSHVPHCQISSLPSPQNHLFFPTTSLPFDPLFPRWSAAVAGIEPATASGCCYQSSATTADTKNCRGPQPQRVPLCQSGRERFRAAPGIFSAPSSTVGIADSTFLA